MSMCGIQGLQGFKFISQLSQYTYNKLNIRNNLLIGLLIKEIQKQNFNRSTDYFNQTPFKIVNPLESGQI